MNVPFVDVLRDPPPLSREIAKNISAMTSSGDFILGRDVLLFERDFASYLGAGYALGVASGTDAILLSLLSLGIRPGDEVIVPAMTFIATILPLLYVGAKPVIVDIAKDRPLIDPDCIEASITKKTKAIMVVHLYGYMCDMEKIEAIAKKNKLYLIEDACQAHGSKINGRFAGTFGDVSAFSFYPAKNLGGYGDGGMVVTSDKIIADKVRLLRNYGQKEKYKHLIVGYNSRLDTIQAAVLRAKLLFLDRFNELRRKHALDYKRRLSDIPIFFPLTGSDEEANYHVFAILTEKRNALQSYLSSKSISTVIHYPVPLHLHPATEFLGYKRGSFPRSEKFAKTTLSLPMFPLMSNNEIDYVCDTVRKFFTHA